MTHEEKVKVSNFVLSAAMMIIGLGELCVILEQEVHKHDKDKKFEEVDTLKFLMKKYEQSLEELGNLLQ